MSCILLKNDIRVAHTVFEDRSFAMIVELTHVHVFWLLLMVTEKMLLRKILFIVGIVSCLLLVHRIVIAEVSVCSDHARQVLMMNHCWASCTTFTRAMQRCRILELSALHHCWRMLTADSCTMLQNVLTVPITLIKIS